MDVLHRFGKDYRVIFMGDAAMSGWKAHFDRVAWLNPSPEDAWHYTSSTRLIDEQMEGKMFPLTINVLEEAMGYLAG
ncbi:hypothetical protein [Endozoicomonas sp. ONNA2]|uniref:hypothetical protein n=1 Tax=Endozoicomonas sp. ONNA2 TaxID=2828741 RepID=UPI0021485BF2|nr:hypothetical protein [Endozoicomonas sp. ONNA2]